ncbi:MAG: hypothetical protein FJX84_02755 [Bacteroidetes bacterium]|nr:hypothetical protein [Bacteroidota bacterium]
MKNLVPILLISFFFYSCKKPEDRLCWKSAGEKSDTVIYLNDFTKLTLNENMTFELVQDSLNKIEISGGKNLITQIRVEQSSDGSVDIKNLNKCNFLRYRTGNITVKIHVKNLSYVAYRGTETLVSQDTLRFPNLQFFMTDGAGSIKLKLNISNTLNGYITHGAGDFQLYGSAKKATFNIMTQGSCDTRNLIIKDVISIVSNANSPCFINAENVSLKAEITGQGNVYYLGNPTSIYEQLTNNGKLIKL